MSHAQCAQTLHIKLNVRPIFQSNFLILSALFISRVYRPLFVSYRWMENLKKMKLNQNRLTDISVFKFASSNDSTYKNDNTRILEVPEWRSEPGGNTEMLKFVENV